MRITVTTYEGISEAEGLLFASKAISYIQNLDKVPESAYTKWGA